MGASHFKVTENILKSNKMSKVVKHFNIKCDRVKKKYMIFGGDDQPSSVKSLCF